MKIHRLTFRSLLLILLAGSVLSATPNRSLASESGLKLCQGKVSQLTSYLLPFEYKVHDESGAPLVVRVSFPDFKNIQCEFKTSEDISRYLGTIQVALPQTGPIQVTYLDERTKQIRKIEKYTNFVMDYETHDADGSKFTVNLDFQLPKPYGFNQLVGLKNFLINLPDLNQRSLTAHWYDHYDHYENIQFPVIKSCSGGFVTVYNMTDDHINLDVNKVYAGSVGAHSGSPMKLCRVQSAQEMDKRDIAQENVKLTYHWNSRSLSVELSLEKDFPKIQNNLTLVVFGDKTVIQENGQTRVYENR